LAVAVAALSLWRTSAQAFGPNLVQNPSFENHTGTQFAGSGFWPQESGLVQTVANFPSWTVSAPSFKSIAVVSENNVTGGNAWVKLAAWPSPKTTSGDLFFIANDDFTNGGDALISQ
jgi:hypothetical protein